MSEAQRPSPAQPAAAADHRPFWLLRIVLRGRWGRWLTGVLFSAVALLVFIVVGGILEPAGDARISTGVALFFSVILAYVPTIHHYICERAELAFDQLAATYPDQQVLSQQLRDQITSKPMPWLFWTMAIGVVCGVTHNLLLLSEGQLFASLTNTRTALPMVITLLVWVSMTALVSSLVDIARLFRRLAQQLPIDPLTARGLTPIGSVAVSTTLAIIGAQAAFPLMFLDPQIHPITFVPGLIGTVVPMVFIFMLPVWPAHRRLAAAKRAALLEADGDLRRLRQGTDGETYSALQPLLTYRREVMEAPEWPFDTSVVGRLMLYLFIPPLTWVGAALIEILVDSAI